MPLSLFAERAYTFADDIHDPETKNQIKRYLLQNRFPGPVVTFIGAEGRGKSTLYGKAAQLASPSSDQVQFAGGAEWKAPVRELKAVGDVFQKAEQEAVGDALLCDAPAFGLVDRDKRVKALLAITDLAILTVQITQPAGVEEVAFAREYLGDIPSVLVLTKCDQADEEDFQEGLEAVLENYGDFPWQAVLLSDLDGNLSEIIANDKVLPVFEQWWQKEGPLRAEEAREVHLARLQQKWRTQARAFLDAKEQELTPLLEQARITLADSAGIAEARQLQEELVRIGDNLPDQALSYYKFHLPDLRRDIDQVTHQFTDRIKAGREISQTEMEQALEGVCREWSEEVRLHVRDKIKPTVDGLQQKAVRYVELITAAAHMQTGQEISREMQGRKEFSAVRLDHNASVPLEGDFDLTLPDKLRFAALPTVSGLGTGVLLLTVAGATFLAPFAPIIALAGAGAMGIGTFGSLSESNRQRRASKVREAILRQMGERERRLEQQFHSDWKQIRDNVRDSVATSKRQLNLLLLQRSPAQDGALNQTHRELTSNIQKIDRLRHDLHRLEESMQGVRFSSDTEE